jgi:predicted nucleic acid-binding protein
VGDYSLSTSTIVEFELFAGATNNQKQQDVREILNWCTLLPFTSDVAVTAAAIYQSLKVSNELVDIRDIFIAATAVTYSLPLMTLNTGHFNRIQRLELLPLPEQ